MIYFPKKDELATAVLKVLKMDGGLATTKEIDQKIIKILNLPEEVVLYEDDTSTGTKLSYRLRWPRTSLKNEGLIHNVKKGLWSLK